MTEKIIYGTTILQCGERLENISLICFFVFVALLAWNLIKICSDSTNDSFRIFKICFYLAIIGASAVGLAICMYFYLGVKMKVIWGLLTFIVFCGYNIAYCFLNKVIEGIKKHKEISWQE